MRAMHLDRVMCIDARCYPIPWARDVYESELSLNDERLYLIARIVNNRATTRHGRTPKPQPAHNQTKTPKPQPAHNQTKTPKPQPAHNQTKTPKPRPAHTLTMTPKPRPAHILTMTIAGYGGVAFEEGKAHITTVAVDPDHRGRGIGAQLLLALMLAARRRRTSLTLEVASDNSAAQALYRRFGLAPVGIRRDYYTGTGLSPDAILMRADEIHQPDYANRLIKIAVELDCA
ncbi:GNAT family N-acetyltransferase [Candidatus Poriferisocius sp.]|uniref:GNAT family N-acetyltransferase n=1 Tax=Candidatus Poriferisocius sp. TaxID=3101276 RepID=UPI003B010A0C